ncbi:MAG: hypothetical protein ACRD30_01655 [Bryobacteraceae bacterium]
MLLCLPLAAASPADWTVVPGVRVGPITASTVRADLDRAFPEGAVENGEIELDEGVVQQGTFVYRKNSSQTLAISWNPDGHPKQIFVCFGLRRGECQWAVPPGIKMGMHLNQIEALNGKPFSISGFGFDYGGNVLSWNGGKLESLDCNGRVVLTLDAQRSDGQFVPALTQQELRAIIGHPVSSAEPAMRKLNPRVVGILFQFAGPDSKKCP